MRFWCEPGAVTELSPGGGCVTLHMTGYAHTYTTSVEKGSIFDIRRRQRLLQKRYIFHFRGTRMSRALRCLGLKMGSENSALKIYVKLSKRHDI